MGKNDMLTRTLAVVGAVLVWFPLLVPFVLSAWLFIERGLFRFDYLMPAELFPLVLAGGLLLLWAAWRARLGWKLFAGGLGLALLMPLGSQATVVLVRLAPVKIKPPGCGWALVVALLGLYGLGVVILAVSAVRLLRVLFRPASSPDRTY